MMLEKNQVDLGPPLGNEDVVKRSFMEFVGRLSVGELINQVKLFSLVFSLLCKIRHPLL